MRMRDGMILVCGGPGFRVYSSSGTSWIIAIGRAEYPIDKTSVHHSLVTDYINLKYVANKTEVLERFDDLIQLLKGE